MAKLFGMNEYDLADALAKPENSTRVWSGVNLRPKPYRVHLGGKKYRRFATLNEAQTFCNQVARRTGVILSIVESKRRIRHKMPRYNVELAAQHYILALPEHRARQYATQYWQFLLGKHRKPNAYGRVSAFARDAIATHLENLFDSGEVQ